MPCSTVQNKTIQNVQKNENYKRRERRDARKTRKMGSRIIYLVHKQEIAFKIHLNNFRAIKIITPIFSEGFLCAPFALSDR